VLFPKSHSWRYADFEGVALHSVLQDFRYGFRLLLKSRAFSLVALLSLALGIGATTAIFSVVDAVLLRPLAMAEPNRVVLVQGTWRDVPAGISVGNFDDMRQQAMTFSAVGASASAGFNLATEDVPERVLGEAVSASYFDVAGVRPVLGRVFNAAEDAPGRAQVVVLSERLWRARLNADRNIAGKTLRINSIPYTVLGVMPKTFDPLLERSELWVPAAFTPQQLKDHDNHYLDVIARFKPGVSQAQAQSELSVVAARERKLYPLDDEERGFRIQPLVSALLGDHRLVLYTILGAVGFVLLIACANIANLQLARARQRTKEIAMRVALGATPRRIALQLLAENVLLGRAGGVLGVLLAVWGVAWLVANGPATVPRLDEARVDAGVLAFACAAALLSSFLFGLAPALRSASVRLDEAFKEGVGRSTGARDAVRSALVIGEARSRWCCWQGPDSWSAALYWCRRSIPALRRATSS
jgi:ABC-type antimicrobial peptide transport system, permease component